MFTKKNNYFLNTWLSKIDYINKYNLEVFHQIPKLAYIKFSISGKFNKKNNHHHKLALLLYILTSSFPQINVKVLTKSDLTTDTVKSSYTLISSLKTPKDCNSFLATFFLDIFKIENCHSQLSPRKFYKYKVPISEFVEINKIIPFDLAMNYDITIHFQFSSKNFLIYSIPSFWLMQTKKK